MNRPNGLSFRPMHEHEVDLLNGMTLDGVRHWRHHKNYPDAVAGLASSLPDEDEYSSMLVRVLERDGEPIGFYSIVDSGDHCELKQMFVDTRLIGGGFGRVLWRDAVGEVRKAYDRMLIVSDPEAVGFYLAMGAEVERSVEVSPGFMLSIMWFDLTET